MKRIAIIGCSGTGKSTLASKLGKLYELPVYHLDTYYWLPNWTARDLDEYKIIHDQLCDQPQWIIDGINTKVLAYRLERADVIIFLDLPRWQYVYNIFTRTYKNWGKRRPDCPDQCLDGFDFRFLKFLKWAWFWRTTSGKKTIHMLNAITNKKILIFKSHAEVNNWLKTLSI